MNWLTRLPNAWVVNMADEVKLFLEDEEVESIEAYIKLAQAGEVDCPPWLLALLQTIIMWKEPV
jgi:hypothetical protein